FVHGTCDRLVPVAAGCRAAPDNPSMETVVLDWLGHTVAVECVLVRRSGGVPLRGLGFGLAASGSLGRGLTEAPSAPGVAAPTPWPVPTSAVVGPGTDGAVALTGPQLARSGQSRRFRAALMSRSTTSPVS